MSENVGVSEQQSAADSYADLAGKRVAATRRVEELEAEQRAASQARAEARAALVEAERNGVRPAERAKLEKALAEAETKPHLLGARIEGARQAVRDAEVALAQHVRDNLSELVAPLETEGQAAAERINAGAEMIVAGLAEREAIAGKISALASMVGWMQPGDVSRTAAEDAARAASALLGAGGETPPELLRDPRQPVQGEPLVEAAS
jgi:chromosome segregation ATPase